MKSILPEAALASEMDWLRSDRVQRLGQWLYNHLVETGQPDPELFYETNNDKARKIFWEKYVKE